MPRPVFIEKEAKRPPPDAFPRVYTRSARAALRHILRARLKGDPRGILLPAYVGLSPKEGSGVLDPVKEAGASFDFYEVSERLVPDLEDLERKLATGRFQLALLIHYFGCAQVDVGDFVRRCQRRDVQVVEDCAHTLLGGLGGDRLGMQGAFAIFSIHKSTWLPDGGFFYDRSGELGDTPLDDRDALDRASLEAFSRLDLVSAAQRRRRFYDLVASWVVELPGLALFFPQVPANAVPLNCPVIVAGGKREPLYFQLIERGILPTALYHTLIPELRADRYPIAHRVSRDILNLPTHPDILDGNLDEYRDALRASVQEVLRT
jgi:dTDP-4-amino-4,6-dideoxygalactose transaminase